MGFPLRPYLNSPKQYNVEVSQDAKNPLAETYLDEDLTLQLDDLVRNHGAEGDVVTVLPENSQIRVVQGEGKNGKQALVGPKLKKGGNIYLLR